MNGKLKSRMVYHPYLGDPYLPANNVKHALATN